MSRKRYTSTKKQILSVYGRVPKYYFFKVCYKTYRESFLRINFYHASEKVLTIGRYKVGYVKVAPLDFFQELSKIVIVERKGSNQQGIQNHTARPHICPSAIVLLPLEQSWLNNESCKHSKIIVYICRYVLYCPEGQMCGCAV